MNKTIIEHSIMNATNQLFIDKGRKPPIKASEFWDKRYAFWQRFLKDSDAAQMATDEERDYLIARADL
jgi:hypothetical protein